MKYHLLPITICTLGIFAVWMSFASVLALVFLVDDAFVAQEFIQVALIVFASVLGGVLLVLFPLSLVGEQLVTRQRHALWLYPMILMGFALVATIIIFVAPFDPVGPAFLVAITAGAFIVYWGILWGQKLLRRLIKQ